MQMESLRPSDVVYPATTGVAALGGRVVSATAIVVQALVTAWLVEIEVIAAA